MGGERIGVAPSGYRRAVEHSLPTRDEQPPDDVVIVIRAGVLSEQSVEDAANRCLEGFGLLGISVEGAMDLSVPEACRTSPRLQRYRRVRLSTFGRLRAAGFPVIATFDAPHYTVALSDLSVVTIARLLRCFDDPIPNPGLDHPR